MLHITDRAQGLFDLGSHGRCNALVNQHWKLRRTSMCDEPGSASFIAIVGSALLCSRLDSFSLCVSPVASELLCDLSEWKLNPLERGLALAGCGCCG